uniref:Uncharacterized protein n=1 Tax=Falco tinnunculus TaxID=100819 RepID=A0A8C4V3V7_FALTI
MYLNNVGLLGRNFRLLKSVVSWVWLLGGCFFVVVGLVFFITVQIAVVFGAKVLEHVLNLCRGNYDFLKQLPVPLLLYIISFLELEDTARLSQVSCSHLHWNNLNLCDTTTPEMKELAQEMGWKQFFFFTNRL